MPIDFYSNGGYCELHAFVVGRQTAKLRTRRDLLHRVDSAASDEHFAANSSDYEENLNRTVTNYTRATLPGVRLLSTTFRQSLYRIVLSRTHRSFIE